VNHNKYIASIGVILTNVEYSVKAGAVGAGSSYCYVSTLQLPFLFTEKKRCLSLQKQLLEAQMD
jgi:hypothetical protein